MIFRQKLQLILIENCVAKFLNICVPKKDYSSLQILEEVLRKLLISTINEKSSVAEDLVKKDVELNKDLLSKISSQQSNSSNKTSIVTKPRFKEN